MISTKYADVIHCFEDECLYSPSTAASVAVLMGWLLPHKRTQFRYVLSKIKRRSQFPLTGDGVITLPNIPVQPAWTGKRWKEAVKHKQGNL